MNPSTFYRHCWRGVTVLLILIFALVGCGDDKKSTDKSSAANDASLPPAKLWKTLAATDVYGMMMDQVATAYPDLTELDEVGSTVVNGRPMGWALAPDGSQLFIILEMRDDDRSTYTCLYTLADEAMVCRLYQSPAHLDDLLDSLVAWAPDNDHLVFHYEWMMRGTDPDLILLETSTGLGVTMTEDLYFSNVFGNSDEPFQMDYAPFWALDSQSVYFFRVSRPVEDAWGDHLQLVNIKLDGGTTTLVADLSGQIDGVTFGMPSQVAMSPDGKQVVIVATDFRDAYTVNLWRVDLTNGKAEQWVDHATLYQAVVPSWSEDPGLIGRDVVWSADGRYVVVSLDSAMHGAMRGDMAEVPPLTYLIVDAASGAVHSLVDMGALTDIETYNAAGGFNHFSPRLGLLTPDGQSLIYATIAEIKEDIIATDFWSVPLNLDTAPTLITTLDLPRGVLATSNILDRVLGTLAPNGVALIQTGSPFRPEGTYLLQFGE